MCEVDVFVVCVCLYVVCVCGVECVCLLRFGGCVCEVSAGVGLWSGCVVCVGWVCVWGVCLCV